MNAQLIVLTIALAFLGNAADAPTAGAESLPQMLPERTRHVLYVNRFSEAWSAAFPNGSGSADVLGVRDGQATQEFGERFAVSAETLARHDVSGLLRAAVAAPGGPQHEVLIVETPTPERARELLSESSRIAEGRGTQVQQISGGSPAGAVFRWTDERDAARFVRLAVVGRLLICATDAQLAEQVAGIASGAKPWKPSHLPGLTEIVAGRRLEWPEDRPGLLWCSNPWVPADGQSQLEVSAQRHGLTGIQAIGGLVTSDSSGALVGQTQILAPGPHQGSLRILQLSPGKDWDAPDWLCRELDELVLLHGKVPRAFDYIGEIFDDLYADGIAGTYGAVLEDLKDENGLNIDLKSQLYAHLGPLVLLSRDRGSDTDAGRASVTYAFQTSQPDHVAKAIHTLMVDDPEAQQVRVDGCEHPLWRMAGVGQEADSAIVVARGFLVYTEDADLLLRALSEEGSSDQSLRAAIDLLRERIPEFGKRDACMVWQRRPDVAEGARGQANVEAQILTLFFSGSAAWAASEGIEVGDFADLLEGFAPVLQRFRWGVGFVEPAGWSLFTRSEKP